MELRVNKDGVEGGRIEGVEGGRIKEVKGG